jgi:hypothetical protein
VPGQSWLRRLLPVLVLAPTVVLSSSVVMAAPAHAAATACTPLKLTVKTKAGVEKVFFTYTNCGTTTTYFTLSGKRVPPLTCPNSGVVTGDVTTPNVLPGQTKVGEYHSPAPTCPGTYKWKADIELQSTETVLGTAKVSYTVL